MPYQLTDKLVVGISSRALFDLDEADAVFRREGLAGYRRFQREHENDILEPGTAMPLIRGLLAIDAPQTPDQERLVEAILLSRNDADSAMRLFNSIEAHGLRITRGALTSGRDPWPYLSPLQCSLFLSADADDVFNARAQGFPAALVLSRPGDAPQDEPGEVRPELGHGRASIRSFAASRPSAPAPSVSVALARRRRSPPRRSLSTSAWLVLPGRPRQDPCQVHPGGRAAKCPDPIGSVDRGVTLSRGVTRAA